MRWWYGEETINYIFKGLKKTGKGEADKPKKKLQLEPLCIKILGVEITARIVDVVRSTDDFPVIYLLNNLLLVFVFVK